MVLGSIMGSEHYAPPNSWVGGNKPTSFTYLVHNIFDKKRAKKSTPFRST